MQYRYDSRDLQVRFFGPIGSQHNALPVGFVDYLVEGDVASLHSINTGYFTVTPQNISDYRSTGPCPENRRQRLYMTYENGIFRDQDGEVTGPPYALQAIPVGEEFMRGDYPFLIQNRNGIVAVLQTDRNASSVKILTAPLSIKDVKSIAEIVNSGNLDAYSRLPGLVPVSLGYRAYPLEETPTE